MIKKMHLLKNKIEAVLAKYPETRDSDKELFIKFAGEYYDCDEEIVRDLLEELPNFESIRRYRQKLQEKRLYQGNRRAARNKPANETSKQINEL